MSVGLRYVAFTVVSADIQIRVNINENFHGKVNIPEWVEGYFPPVVPLPLDSSIKYTKDTQEDIVKTDGQVQYKH